MDFIESQFETEPETGVRQKPDADTSPKRSIRELACQASLQLGGTPAGWRQELWADVKFMLDTKEWQAERAAAVGDKAKKDPGPPPKRVG